MRLRPIATACLLAVLAVALSARATGAPPSPVELDILTASRLTTDADGRRAPLFFHVADDRWLPPLPVYVTAVIRSAGGGERSARVMTIAVGAIDVALVFLCARGLFGQDSIAIVAALLLLFTPVHFRAAVSGTSAILPVPFVLGAVMALSDRRHLARVAIAAVTLGVGMYSDFAAPLGIGLLLIAFAASAWIGSRNLAAPAVIVSGTLACLLPAVIWFVLHRETYPDTFGRWFVFLPHLRNPIDGVRAFLNWNTLSNRVSLYWGFLDPAWLFFGQDAPCLLASLPALVLGFISWRSYVSPASMTILAGGALLYAMAGSTLNVPHYAFSAMPAFALAAFIMAAGFAELRRRLSVAVVPYGLVLVAEWTRWYWQSFLIG